jgi:hypothetical protein
MNVWYREDVYGNMTDEMARGWRKVKKFFSEKGTKNIFVTSIRDKIHGDDSRHPQGDAIDFYTDNVTLNLDILRKILGINNFDIVCESDHIHIEYDPE